MEKVAKEKTTKEKEIKEPSVFETLSKIDVNEHTEQKNGLTYLSWAWAWGIAKSIYPDANYIIYENRIPAGQSPVGYLTNYFTDGRTCWVKTGVVINGIEHIEELPIMDYRNKSISFDNVTSFDVNKSIQRSLTKALARHGLGLYIYAGEDLPNELLDSKEEPKVTPKKVTKTKTTPKKETTNNSLEVFGDTVVESLTEEQKAKIKEIAKDNMDKVKEYLISCKANKLSMLTKEQAQSLIDFMQG